jgi:hypothetical protein
VLVLAGIYGYSHEECAAMLGIAVGTCKAQLHRARSVARRSPGRLGGKLMNRDDRLDAALQGLARASRAARVICGRQIAARHRRRTSRYDTPPFLVMVAVGCGCRGARRRVLTGNRNPAGPPPGQCEYCHRTDRQQPRNRPIGTEAGTAAALTCGFRPGAHTLDEGYVAARRHLAGTLQARIERMPPCVAAQARSEPRRAAPCCATR